MKAFFGFLNLSALWWMVQNQRFLSHDFFPQRQNLSLGNLIENIKTGVEDGFGSHYRGESNVIALSAFSGVTIFWCMKFTKIEWSVLLQNKTISIDTRMVEVETNFPYRCESEYGYESKVEEALFGNSELTVLRRKDRISKIFKRFVCCRSKTIFLRRPWC